MSKIKSPSRNNAASEDFLWRSEQGHQQAGADSRGAETGDLHPNWLKKWRCLRAGTDDDRRSEKPAELMRDLQNQIAQTPAHTMAGLQAQAELISELAWNDVTAATARRLVAGLKRLQRSDAQKSESV